MQDIDLKIELTSNDQQRETDKRREEGATGGKDVEREKWTDSHRLTHWQSQRGAGAWASRANKQLRQS